MESTNFGFVPSKIDGTEYIFGAPTGQEITLPTKYTFRPYLPPVLNQGSLSICVPCSCSSYLNWKENLNDGSNVDNKIALMDIYKARTNYGEGMSFKEAFHYLRHNGVRYAKGVTGIGTYGMVTNKYTLMNAIIMNGPCFGALPVYSDNCDFWNKTSSGLLGYHAISIVGYDEKGFIIRNSWGPSFCDDGYTTIPYEDFNKFLELWTIMS